MSTSDTPIAYQGRRQRNTRPISSTTHSAGNLHAYSSNAQSHIDYSFQPTTPPRTPRRTAEDPSITSSETNGYTSNDASHIPPNSSAKTKSKTKNRQKQVLTSPSAPRNGRATPPLNGGAQSAGLSKPAKTPSSIAYAGPTFHASPAPSALPLPSFYSKSVPESPAPIAINAAKDETESSSGSDSPTPPISQLNGNQHQREDSPLDFFFNADRAERARARGSSSATGPFQPPFESPPVNNLPPHPTRAHSSQFSGGRPSSMFAMELESTNSPGKPVGAPFATPYSERIKAARSMSTHSQPLMNNNKSPAESPSSLTSQALRDYLFAGTPPPSHSPASESPAPLGSLIRSISGPSTPVGNQQFRHPNRSYHSDFPFGNESLPNSSFRTSSRTSGLRQEISHAKTPAQRPDISERVTSAPPAVSTNSYFVNNASKQNIDSVISPISTPTSLSNGNASQRSRSDDLRIMEERLRGVLKITPAKESSERNFPCGPPDSAPAYRGMNGGYSGVLGS